MVTLLKESVIILLIICEYKPKLNEFKAIMSLQKSWILHKFIWVYFTIFWCMF